MDDPWPAGNGRTRPVGGQGSIPTRKGHSLTGRPEVQQWPERTSVSLRWPRMQRICADRHHALQCK